ncbi:MAG TPA: amidohydrolase family protein [Anaerolineales bacterium]|nr:amidohydrolase family protein [Anaerolineales bacterium]
MDFLLQNFTLIDGTGQPPIPGARILIRGDKIEYAGPASGWTGTDEETTELDLGGGFVLPGLIDAHVHLCGSGEADSQFRAPDGAMALKILRNAQRNLAAGITTVRDLGGWNELEFVVREWIRRGEFAGPRMCLAGRFISISEAGADHYDGMYRVADGVDEVRRAVREQVKHGADLVKIGVTGAVLVESGEPGLTHFNMDEIRALVEEAAKFGRRAAAHAHGIDGIRKALKAGVYSIEHGTFLHQDPAAIRFMAEKGVFLVPTLKVDWDIIHADDPTIPEWILEKNRATQGDAERSLKLAYNAGVPIAMGSDVGTPRNVHGENGLEVYWMAQAGLSPLDAIAAATGNAARLLGWDGWLGTLEKGKAADLIVLDENPLDDLRLLADKSHLRLVMKDGQVAACHRDHDLPHALLAKRMLWIE